jgi:hypothetical protein
MNQEKKTEEKKVDIKLQKIELPSIDMTQYIGKKSKIVSSNVYEGEYGHYLKVESEVVDTIQLKDDLIELNASRIFSLFIDEEGVVGWGDKTQLGMFLEKMKVSNPDELIGKDIIIQSRVSKKDGKEYLTF